MSEFSLHFKVPDGLSEAVARRTFYWPADGPGSFFTKLKPRFGALGPVAPLNADFARIAVMVYAADRSVVRAAGTVNWTARDYDLTIPVSDPEAWRAVHDRLVRTLAFLSGDTWAITFTKAPIPAEPVAENQYSSAERVVLLSGGADSAAGALLARTLPEDHVLVSHFGGNGIGRIQRLVAEAITTLRPDGSSQQHCQVRFSRMQHQPDGTKFANEPSTRTRSLLFLALGLCVASVNGVPLWIPENGFASLNPAMGADQFGSLSTRTTHPWFLSEVRDVLADIGAEGRIENPFAQQTKGEMFTDVAAQLGPDAASMFLSSTDSCGFTNKRFWAIEKTHHCGTCFGCLLRRASFKAAALDDRSVYAVDNPPSADAADVLQRNSLLPSIRSYVGRGVTTADIASIRLPTGYSPSAARELCVRGSDELRLLL
ncbi:hypothetical protein [Cellulosimicrobium sp. RS]|uniref:hypothetical protein n=1 Tax=Cellulosimicrobium sp. RS TaxID=3381347 RepID=UPI0038FCB924